MKDQYFGNIQDYRKFGLLRCLQGTGDLNVLVAWCLTPDVKESSRDKLAYLDAPGTWRRHDSDLFDWLAGSVGGAQPRQVRFVEQSGLIPRAQYFDDLVPDGREDRARWSKALLAAAARADLVFLDPDIGLEIPSRPVGTRDSSRYVSWLEVQDLWQSGHSLLIYQHFPHKPRDAFVLDTCAILHSRTPDGEITTFRTPDVVFFLVSQPRHRTILDAASRCMIAAWQDQFSIEQSVKV